MTKAKTKRTVRYTFTIDLEIDPTPEVMRKTADRGGQALVDELLPAPGWDEKPAPAIADRLAMVQEAARKSMQAISALMEPALTIADVKVGSRWLYVGGADGPAFAPDVVAWCDGRNVGVVFDTDTHPTSMPVAGFLESWKPAPEAPVPKRKRVAPDDSLKAGDRWDADQGWAR